MTLKELYLKIDGDYSAAMRILPIESLLDKLIRKLPDTQAFADLAKAGETMDPAAIFESAHAIKGVSGNLGLTGLYRLASELSDEFRPGSARKHTDDEVKGMLADIAALYEKTAAGIREYAAP